MTTDTTTQPVVARPRFRGVWLAIGACTIASACTLILAEVALWLLDRPPVTRIVLQLAWLLTPWRRLPNVLMPESVLKSSMLSDLGWLSRDYPTVVPGILIPVLAGTMLWQGIIYFGMALLYRWCGWPRYARETAWRRELWPALGEFAWRAFWVIPAVRLVSNAWLKLGWALVYGGYPALLGYSNDTIPYDLLNAASIIVIYCWLAARVLRRRILAGIDPEQRRCEQCNYLLRGLPELRCPECGSAFQRDARAAIRLGQVGRLRWKLARWSSLAVLVVSLTAPVWVTLALLFTPLGTQLGRPSGPPGAPFYNSIGADLFLARQGAQLRFPLRGDHAWLVRDGAALAVIRMERDGRAWYYRWGYWPDGSLAGSAPPATGARKRIFKGNICGEPVPIGPWRLYLQLGGFDAVFLSVQPQIAVEVVDTRDWPIPPPEGAPESEESP